jgi:predicted peptidase
MANQVLKFMLSLFILITGLGSLKAQTVDEQFQKEVFLKQGDTLKYRILYPYNFSEDIKYPVVLFLHGAGERGNDNEAQLMHGGKLFLEKNKDFPSIVIFPQAPQDDFWARVKIDTIGGKREFRFIHSGTPTRSLEAVMALMDSITSQKYVDESRVYVGGLSMGAMGTFELPARRPQMFAAAFAICGGADPEVVKSYPENLNIWIFHGEKDNVVSPEFSKIMAREINSAGGNAKLSLYPDANHNSWDPAFAEPYLLPWLFSHSKE